MGRTKTFVNTSQGGAQPFEALQSLRLFQPAPLNA